MKKTTKIFIFTMCLSLSGLVHPAATQSLQRRQLLGIGFNQKTAVIVGALSLAAAGVWWFRDRSKMQHQSRATGVGGAPASATQQQQASSQSAIESKVSREHYVRTDRALAIRQSGLSGRSDIYFNLPMEGVSSIGVDYDSANDTIADLKKAIAKGLDIDITRVTLFNIDKDSQLSAMKDSDKASSAYRLANDTIRAIHHLGMMYVTPKPWLAH